MKIQRIQFKFLLAVFTCIIFINAPKGQAAITHPAVIQSDACLSGPYATRDYFVQVLTDFMPFNPMVIERMVTEQWFDYFQTHFECYRFSYQVDGHQVLGYMLRQAQREGEQPALIYHRGGNANFGALTPWLVLNRLSTFANEGYTIFASNLRAEDEFGGADLADSRLMIEIAKHVAGVDQQKIALWGESRGATQMMQTARGRTDIHALVFSMGVADAAKSLEQRPAMEQVYQARVPHFASQREQALLERSVVAWSEELPAAPILIIHGDQDTQVNVAQAYLLAEHLTAIQHPYQLKVYSGMAHSMNKEAQADMLQWLKKTFDSSVK